ncbi:prepilin-type N-terminal cleavage/methylation domain-containing protein [Cellulomonas sp. S1-8]|uniref:prepilin-type N-terminal cleavage/methylation domain-containing protein n=1 Tax=Cellulomonas sp. S1-8 TaxID=2904790 RepID=UPI002244CFDC|nr:prepilin-type N-terminal cleavage/methylation domain-containing protein [Cellulomonas sp. S1-8]UZN05160.1 prepilin-type N-terminal cleavage/methylation domain-containing protein [Cellulomonas sp. S1-8]
MRTWWHRLHRVTRDERGLSLVEVLVAMLIFAMVSAGLAYSMIGTLNLTREARVRVVAANLAAEEIDLARDTADLFALLDETRSVTLNGDVFRVQRSTQWVSDPAADFSCGSGGGTLRYKRVNVTVTWGGMRASALPVRSDTVLNPDDHINDPTKGTILVSVLRADGTGNQNVTITASPTTGSVINSTDAQGCTYVLRVPPGTYDIRAQRTGHVSDAQVVAPMQTVSVTPGTTASVGFQLDQAATFNATLAPGAPVGTKVPTGTPVPVSVVSTYGIATPASVGGGGTLAPRYSLHPFTSGYQPFAGSCLSSDPRAWPEVVEAGTTFRADLPEPVAAAPGGTVTMPVAMGLVQITGGGSGTYLRAESMSPATTEPPTPGCVSIVSYTYGNVVPAAAATVVIALPYGTWRLLQGNSTSQTNVVSGTRITPLLLPAPSVPQRITTTAAGVITVDPRMAVTP